MKTRHTYLITQHCITRVLFICLAVQQVHLCSRRQLHDSKLLKLRIHGQKWGMTFNEYSISLKIIIRQKAGTLKHGRRGHGAIFDGEKFLVIGGEGVLPGDKYLARRLIETEVCTLKGQRMTCVEQATALEGYRYPELFLVADDFGKDVSKC